jgi:hypothetical protein
MKIRQLSLFLENRPGQLRTACKILGDAGIDVLTMSLADTQQFGILRVVVRDFDKAKKVLEAQGVVVNVTEVLAVDVPDHPGGLAEILEGFEKADLGIEYMYPFARGKMATLLFRVEDPDKAEKILTSHGVRLVPAAELLARTTK